MLHALFRPISVVVAASANILLRPGVCVCRVLGVCFAFIDAERGTRRHFDKIASNYTIQAGFWRLALVGIALGAFVSLPIAVEARPGHAHALAHAHASPAAL